MKRHYSTIDNKTGYELILSEVSYNFAGSWLSADLAKHDYAVSGTHTMKNGLIAIFTERISIDTGDLLDEDRPIGMYSGRTFFYDASRAYLLGE